LVCTLPTRPRKCGTLGAARHRIRRSGGTAITDSEELALVNAAIEAILTKGVSSYSIAGRSATSLDLPVLYARQKELTVRIQAAAGTSRTLVARFRAPG